MRSVAVRVYVILLLTVSARTPGASAQDPVLAQFFGSSTPACEEALRTAEPRLDLSRVTLRRAREADRSTLVSILNDPEVARCYLLNPKPNAGDAEIYFGQMRASLLTHEITELATLRTFVFVIEAREPNGVLGLGMIESPGAGDAWEIGYALAAGARGRGFATEVVRGVTDFIRHVDPGAVIEATPLKNNSASHAVLIRAGYVATSRQYENHRDRCIWASTP